MSSHRLLAITLCAVWANAAATAELRPPVTPNPQGVSPLPPAADNCAPAKLENPVRAASLIVRNTWRPDVGPYKVMLPGYATAEDPGADHYTPFVIEAQPGDTLRIDLDNELDASFRTDGVHDQVNLHVHGMIVTPSSGTGCEPLGDYIFFQTGKGSVAHYRFDIPKTLAGEAGFGLQYYPSGLYWFHSHMHGTARDLVQSGQAGLLSIKPPTGASISDDPTAVARAGAKDRYMVLRDIQLAVPHGKTPDTMAAPGQVANWLSGDAYDTQACRAASNPGLQMLSGKGFCGHTRVYGSTRSVTDATNDTVWLFTINGQHYPDVTIAAGETEIWRIANLSPTVTYSLELADASGTEQDLQVLTLDGVVAGTLQNSNSQTLRPGVTLKHVLLMPAARAEILIDNTAPRNQDVQLTLRTQGLETSGKQPASVSQSNYQGDPWPPVDLAHIVLKAGGNVSARPDLLKTTFSRPSTSALPDRATQIPANCVTLPNAQYRRKITFAQADPNLFKLGSEVVDRSGRSIDPTTTGPHSIAPVQFAHAMPPESTKHVCAQLGTTEVWELVNTTNELHNFHIHQTKFRLARASDPGAPPNLSDNTVFQDPGGVLAGQEMPELAQVQAAAGIDVWHDTIPVPPKDSRGIPGTVFVAIPFTDKNQVGTFVFHCHILEHEDNGMMAVVQIFDPSRGASLQSMLRYAARNAANEVYCGNPPRDFVAAGLEKNFSVTVGGRLLNSIQRIVGGFNWLARY